MVALFHKELDLCGVTEGQTVAVLSEAEQSPQDYVTGFMAAASELGAHAFNVNVLAGGVTTEQKAGDVGQTALAGNRPAIEALKSADIVVDLMFLLFSKEQLEIQKAGTRILLVVEPFEVLARLFPTRELRERVGSRLSLVHHEGPIQRRPTSHTSWASIRRCASTASRTRRAGGTIGRAASCSRVATTRA